MFRFGNKKNSLSEEIFTNVDVEEAELIVSSFTLIPDQDPIYLPYAYKYFEWYYPECELSTKKWIVDNVKKDWVVIDVGANIGYFSLLFSRIAAAVHAFEPTSTFELLKKNLDFFNVSNVSAYKLAVSSYCGIKTDSYFRLWGKNSEEIEIESITLDSFVNSQNLKRLDLIKIDTDGYEIEVLKGSRAVLEKFNPTIIVEFSHALNTRGHEVGELIELLIEFGYDSAIMLESNNLIVNKKNQNPLFSWSDKFTFLPHDYNISFEREKIDHFLKLNKIKFEFTQKSKFHNKKQQLEFESQINDLKITVITHKNQVNKIVESESDFYLPNPNCRLKSRGPKMEVNDIHFLKYLYQNKKIDFHLEFGTWEGFGTSLFCQYSNGYAYTINLPNGELDSESNASYPSSYYPQTKLSYLGPSSEQDKSSDSAESIGWIYKLNGFNSRVTQILSDSRSLDVNDFGLIKFDTVLIDGGHEKEVVINDTVLTLKLLNDDGIIVWHDFTMDFNDYTKYESVKGVAKAIFDLTPVLQENNIELFWIKDTWLLVGKKI